MGTISFDFDDTLSHVEIQEMAYTLKKKGYTIVICTARFDDAEHKVLNTDLFLVVHNLGLTENDVIFCGGEPKHNFLNDIDDLIFHIDDNYKEVVNINLHCEEAIGLHILQDEWPQQLFNSNESSETTSIRNILQTILNKHNKLIC